MSTNEYVLSPDQIRQLLSVANEEISEQQTISIEKSDQAVPFSFIGYQILELISQGGQAVVYKALQESTQRVVALKILPSGILSSIEAKRRFEREADLVAQMNHPNIVRIFDSGIDRGNYFFAMEYIEGRPFNEYVENNELGLFDRISLFQVVCQAVLYAHQKGIIHRDLKFGNILVDHLGQPRILDFGLAKFSRNSSDNPETTFQTMTGHWAGSPATMSPEQTTGRSEEIDIRSDIYSLGVLLYHLLTDQYPYPLDRSIWDVLNTIRTVDPIRPRKLNRQIDSDLEAIVCKCLEKEPVRRYQSVTALTDDLNNWFSGEPIHIRSDSTFYLLRKIASKHRFTASVVSLILLIILGFSIFSIQMTAQLQIQNKTIKRQIKDIRAAQQYFGYLGTEITFTYFLDAYQTNQIQNARVIKDYFSEDTHEFQAASILLNSQMTDEIKQILLNQSMKKEDGFYTLVMAEIYLHQKNEDQAIQCYKEYLVTAQENPNSPLSKRAKAKLYELTQDDENPETQNSIRAQKGDYHETITIP